MIVTRVLRRRTATVAVCILAAAAPAVAADWPRFRGPAGDGRSQETGLLERWPEGGPEEAWRVDLGAGISGVSIAGGRAYTMFAAASDEFAVCLDAATGREIWRTRTGGKFASSYGDGPRSTPTVESDRVYVLGAKGRLHALAAKDGTRIWTRDLTEDYDTEPPRWGYSSSPVIEGGLLLLDVGGSAGGSIVAFDKATGEEAWRSQEDKAGYSTPLVVTIDDRRQAVFLTGTRVVSVSPDDGSLLWRQPWKTSYDVNAAMPVLLPPDRVFVSSGYDVGATVWRLARSGVEQIWRNREMKNRFSSSVYHDGYLYGFDESTLKCIDASTGERRWRKRGLGHGSLIYADGRLLVLGDEGTLALVRATPRSYQELGRVEVLAGTTWTLPSLADGRLFLRDRKQLVSLDVSE